MYRVRVTFDDHTYEGLYSIEGACLRLQSVYGSSMVIAGDIPQRAAEDALTCIVKIWRQALTRPVVD